MNPVYKKIVEFEEYYKDMKKKYPLVNIWDDLLEFIKKYKDKILNNYEFDNND